MSYYEVLLFLHILATIVWIGAGVCLQFLTFRGRQTKDGQFLQSIGAMSDWLAQRLFIPSSLSVFVLGVLLTIEGPWSFDTLWVDLGLAGFAFSFVTGLFFLRPEGERIGKAIAAHGPRSQEAGFYMKRIDAVQRLELVILVLVVAAMSIKPTGEDEATILIGALILAAAVAIAARAISRLPAPTSPSIGS
jgi:uncharacterized membrane protein